MNFPLFATMKTNCGRILHDTGATMAGYIGTWLNDGYLEASKRCMWVNLIDNDYTFESVDNTVSYSLPGGFTEELFVANIATGEMLDRYTLGKWWRERYSAYSADSITKGTSKRYTIEEEDTVTGKIHLDPPPNVAETYAMPYKRQAWPMLAVAETCTTNTANKIIASAGTFITDGVKAGMRVLNVDDNTYDYISTVDSETQLTMASDLCPDGNEVVNINYECLISDLGYVLEAYALSQGFAFLENFGKADWYMQEYRRRLSERVASERSKINQLYQMISETYRIEGIKRLTGDVSYDSI